MVDPAPGEEAALPARRAGKRGLDPEAGGVLAALRTPGLVGLQIWVLVKT